MSAIQWYTITINGTAFDFSVNTTTYVAQALYLQGNYSTNLLVAANTFRVDTLADPGYYTYNNNQFDGTIFGSVVFNYTLNGYPYIDLDYGNNGPNSVYGYTQSGGSGTELQSDVSVSPIADPTCYNKGTKILCIDDVLKPIEELCVGDLVKTLEHGYKAVKYVKCRPMTNNPDKWKNCMFKIKGGDLTVTGGHSILVDELSNDILEKYKTNDVSLDRLVVEGKKLELAGLSDKFEKIEDNDMYIYYHLVLENENETEEYGIYADGVLAETCSEKWFVEHMC